MAGETERAFARAMAGRWGAQRLLRARLEDALIKMGDAALRASRGFQAYKTADMRRQEQDRFDWPDLPIEAVTSIAWGRYTALSVTEAAHLMALTRRRAQRWREDAEAVKP